MTLSRRSPTLENVSLGYFHKRRASAGRVEQRAIAANLAPEILLQIFSYLKSAPGSGSVEEKARRRARASAPLVCRSWLAAASTALYHTVDILTTEQASLFLRTLCSNPNARSMVRVLILPSCSATSNSRGATHRVGQCPMSEVYTTILRMLRGLSGLSIPDLHVAHDAFSRLGVRVLALDCSFGGCTAAEYPSLLSSAAALRSVSELSISGTPFNIPGSRPVAMPRLHALHLSRIHANSDDLRALIACAPRLRTLRATRVRVHSGLRNPMCGSIQLQDWAGPCAGSLRELYGDETHLGCLAKFGALEKIVFDQPSRPSALPRSLRQLGLIVAEPPCENTLCTVLDTLPMLELVDLTCSASSSQTRIAALQLRDICARRGVAFDLRVCCGAEEQSQSSHAEQKRPTLQHRESWSTRNLFNPMRRALKAL